ncbi:MAG: transcriptional regulator [Sedimentibacter sp.]
MAILVSVIGPPDLVDRIIEEGKNYKDIEMVGYMYKDVTETMTLINQCINNTDLILFAGPIPYNIARKNEEGDIPMLYVSYSGTALYKALFNYINEECLAKNKCLRFSVDTIHKTTVEEMLKELNLTNYEIYVNDSFTISSKELEKFHTDLYNSGKTDFMITCLTSTYDKLKSNGMCTYRIIPTISSIREALNMVYLEAQNIISKKAQLCVGIMKIISFSNNEGYNFSKYEQSRIRLAVSEQFIDFCEEVKASMKFDGGDEYIFFATRGAIEKLTNYYRFMPIIREITEQNSIDVCVGLGYGYSANEAEKNSRDALKYAINHKKNCCYIIMEDGKVRGPLQSGRIIEFYSSSQDSNIASIAKKTNLSVMTINRIFGVIDSYGKNAITASDVAEVLNITKRSARRIMNDLEQAEIVKVIGEEQPIGRGRPRKVYGINK